MAGLGGLGRWKTVKSKATEFVATSHAVDLTTLRTLRNYRLATARKSIVDRLRNDDEPDPESAAIGEAEAERIKMLYATENITLRAQLRGDPRVQESWDLCTDALPLHASTPLRHTTAA